MKHIFKAFFLSILDKLVVRYYSDNLSYSQEGEDQILDRFFANKLEGFYIDVGAHHPKRFSNTYKFYLKGWRGINIDAMPGSMTIFNKMRPRDVNVEAAISNTESVLKYYAFNEPALNGFSKEVSDERNGFNGYKILFEKDIKTRKLSDILKAHSLVGTHVDFLSVDVEGLDLEVLKSNDWDTYRPTMVLVEILDFSNNRDEIREYLEGKGYMFFAKAVNTVFFKDSLHG